MTPQKNKKHRLLAFSFFDWLFMSLALSLTIGLLVFPFLNPNNQALVLLMQKKHEKAEKKWHKLLIQDPFSASYRMNLALNYQIGDQTDKALQEYQITRNLNHTGFEKGAALGILPSYSHDLKHKNSNKFSINQKLKPADTKQIMFFSFFNSATAQTKNIQQALHFYQSALAFQPDSRPVKTNIELLTQNQINKKKKEKKSQGDKKQEPQPDKKQNEEEKVKQNQPDKKESTNKDKKPNKDQKDQQEKESKQKAGDTKENQEEKSSQLHSDQQNNPEQNTKKIAPQGLSPPLDTEQTEAILKALSEQEKQIKKRRRNHSRKNRSSKEKDW